MVAAALWGLGVYEIAQTETMRGAFFWWRIAHIGVIFIPVAFLHFVHVLLDLKNKRAVYVSYFMGALFLTADATPYFISNVRWVFNSFYYDSPPGPIYVVFVAFFAAVIIYGHYLLYREYRKSSGKRKQQIFSVLLAGVLGFGGGSTAYLPVFGIDVHPAPGTFMISLYAATIFYAIVRYRLFNAKIIVVEFLTMVTWGLSCLGCFYQN